MIAENDVWRNLVPPYRLAEKAEAILGNNPKLAELFSKCALNIDLKTEPSGARVYMKEYSNPDGEWFYLGVSPFEKVRVPIGIFRWKLEKEGYETVLAAASTWNVGGGAESHAFTEYMIQLVKDFRRSVDYLETRPDIDSGKLAYYGMSWGGWLGAIIPAVEERLGASVVLAGGSGGAEGPRPVTSTM
jgi:hypothetical protein